jgi:hypothetical protein
MRIPILVVGCLVLLLSWLSYADDDIDLSGSELHAHLACADNSTMESLEECLGLPVTADDDDDEFHNSTDTSFQAAKFPRRGRLKWKISWGAAANSAKYAAHRKVIMVRKNT